MVKMKVVQRAVGWELLRVVVWAGLMVAKTAKLLAEKKD